MNRFYPLMALCLIVGLISGFLASYATYQPQIQSMESRIEGLESQISSLQVENTKMKKAVNTYESQIENLQIQLASYEKQAKSLKSEIQNLEAQVANLQKKNESLKAEVTEYQKQNEALKQEVNLLKEEWSSFLIEVFHPLEEEIYFGSSFSGAPGIIKMNGIAEVIAFRGKGAVVPLRIIDTGSINDASNVYLNASENINPPFTLPRGVEIETDVVTLEPNGIAETGIIFWVSFDAPPGRYQIWILGKSDNSPLWVPKTFFYLIIPSDELINIGGTLYYYKSVGYLMKEHNVLGGVKFDVWYEYKDHPMAFLVPILHVDITFPDGTTDSFPPYSQDRFIITSPHEKLILRYPKNPQFPRVGFLEWGGKLPPENGLAGFTGGWWLLVEKVDQKT